MKREWDNDKPDERPADKASFMPLAKNVTASTEHGSTSTAVEYLVETYGIMRNVERKWGYNSTAAKCG